MVILASLVAATPSSASDHLDSPSVIADSRTDIGDLYAWMAPDGHRLNLAMTIVGHSFSDKVAKLGARRTGGRRRTFCAAGHRMRSSRRSTSRLSPKGVR